MARSATDDWAEGLHPAVEKWFTGRFADGPTEAQARGWPSIRSGADTLIAAPTGSGKTLAGFLVAIDAAYRAHESGDELRGHTRLVYVSPLKALAVDVHQNLEQPLAEIAEVARGLGLEPAPVTVAVRTGDTTASARSAMVRDPPTFLVTTPESLYLLLTAERSRAFLSEVRTVIVDEIHALARDKRGSHLAVTLERLEHLQLGARPQRIGLSATQRPIEATGRLLVGSGTRRTRCEDGPPDGRGETDGWPTSEGPRRPQGSEDGGDADDGQDPPVEIVDCGHRRELSVRIELPDTELGAVATSEQLGEIVDRIASHVADHRTTLVFVNTRRLSERLAHMLGERLGPEQVAAHHGSLSTERRKRTESRLRAGDLRALVATASLELGIDVGPVELVCQVGSPRSIATFLQRVGRSNHSRTGVPEGICFPMTRDELVECAALMAAVRAGRLDSTTPPTAPLDILAQQIVAEVAAAGEWEEDALYQLVRAAAPYAGLGREDFDAVVELASEGIPTGRGSRMAYLHRDRVNGVLRPRRGARLAALTSGGAIAEVGDYRVVADPDDTVVGSVNEDFAIESMVGDVFLLGTHSWRIRRVTQGEVRVTDAQGAHPTIPFWVGEAPSRTMELSEEVSELRSRVGAILAGTLTDSKTTDEAPSDGAEAAIAQVRETCGLDADAARQLVDYLSCAIRELGVLPTLTDVVFERFFDEAGGMQLVVHAPFGGRVNRALGLALRKRFCATFDFELQAAATDDAVVLSLGAQHSFALESAPRLLRSTTAAATLRQAVLASPMFASRWRWNLNRALAVLRFRGGKKNPLPIQRMESDDLMAAVFPALAACQENAAAGPVEIPDHVLVRQTLDDCLHEAMDVDAMVEVVERIERGEIHAHFVESTEPSVLSHEILNGKPFTFLDDAPLEERRTRAVQLRRGLPVEARDLGRLDPAAIERVRAEAAADPRGAEELHDLLTSLVVCRPIPEHQEWFDELVGSGRASSMVVPPPGQATADAEPKNRAGEGLWCATERKAWAEALFGRASLDGADSPDPDAAAALALRGHLDISGPVTVEELAERTALGVSRVQVGLARLEAEGFAMRGHFDPAVTEEQWCARRLLARIHVYTQQRLRREIEPVSAQDFVRFLLRWQHVAPGTQRQGRAGLLAVVDQLQGFELAAGAWEEQVFAARVEQYRREWLEDLCLSGELVWGRLALRPPSPDDAAPRRGASTPSRATPVTFALREDLPWLLRAARADAVPEEPSHGAARDVLEALRANGAMFHSELRSITGRLPVEVEEGLWDLVARGLVTADGFGAVRSLFSAREAWKRRHRQERRARLGSRRVPGLRQGGEGRWAQLPVQAGATLGDLSDPDALAEQVAAQLLARWGVVFWDLTARESLAVAWREVLWALRRLEARGLVRGGRFVNGFAGEQYALPEAVEELRRVRRSERKEEIVRLGAADPLNITGIVLPGTRVPAVRTKRVSYRDGLLMDEEGSRSAALAGPDRSIPTVAGR
ncbi:MAG TPA: DEAD/DEAH box helicase [Acidimicrobiales bacterium]|nr:DEAD/DEAH box helicase [Acidimicrobiales bacterium]